MTIKHLRDALSALDSAGLDNVNDIGIVTWDGKHFDDVARASVLAINTTDGRTVALVLSSSENPLPMATQVRNNENGFLRSGFE